MDDAGYEFTVDWFSLHIPVWSQLLDQKRPSRIVEIGAYEGRSTCYLIETCCIERRLDLWSIDTWEGGVDNDPTVMGDVERRFDHNVAHARTKATHPAAVEKMKSLSSAALAGLLAGGGAGTMDMVYVDGSHQAPDVLSDAVMGFALLKVGGLMIFDDYLWHIQPPLQKDPLNMPKPGIDAFMNIFMRKMNIIAVARCCSSTPRRSPT